MSGPNLYEFEHTIECEIERECDEIEQTLYVLVLIENYRERI